MLVSQEMVLVSQGRQKHLRDAQGVQVCVGHCSVVCSCPEKRAVFGSRTAEQA